jgi:hypothetical protein
VYIPTFNRQQERSRRGATRRALLVDLDRQFRASASAAGEQDGIRRHMRVFVNGDEARTSINALADTDDIVHGLGTRGG